MKSLVLKYRKYFYTYLSTIFQAIDNKQLKYNWLITNCECYFCNKNIDKLFSQNILGFLEKSLQLLFQKKIHNLFGVFFSI